MHKTGKQTANIKKEKPKLPDRSRVLLERILRRREEIRERAGVLSDSSVLIREERERRF